MKTFSSKTEKAQVAQRSCRVLGDIQKPPGHGPGQPALDGPARAVGVDQMTCVPSSLCDMKKHHLWSLKNNTSHQ